jgi:hypothetical protein
MLYDYAIPPVSMFSLCVGVTAMPLDVHKLPLIFASRCRAAHKHPRDRFPSALALGFSISEKLTELKIQLERAARSFIMGRGHYDVTGILKPMGPQRPAPKRTVTTKHPEQKDESLNAYPQVDTYFHAAEPMPRLWTDSEPEA